VVVMVVVGWGAEEMEEKGEERDFMVQYIWGYFD